MGTWKSVGVSGNDRFWDLPPEERQAEVFERTALDPEAWFAVAEKLTAATEALLPSAKASDECFVAAAKSFAKSGEETAVITIEFPPDVRAIILMLAAYAAENLCKGLLVAMHPEEVRRSLEEGDGLPRSLLQHDLPKLLDKVCYAPEQEDRVLAWRLSRAAVWSARYPVPTAPKKLREGLDGATAGAWAIFTSEDARLVTEFLGRLKSYCLRQAEEKRTDVEKAGA